MNELSGVCDEISRCAVALEAHAEQWQDSEFPDQLKLLKDAANEIGKAFCGSWMGYHANVYYQDLKSPPAGANFSVEWGLKRLFAGGGSTGNWIEWDPDHVKATILDRAGNPDLDAAEELSKSIADGYFDNQSELKSILATVVSSTGDSFLRELLEEISSEKVFNAARVLVALAPKGSVITRDQLAIGQGRRVPPHYSALADAIALPQPAAACDDLAAKARSAERHLNRLNVGAGSETRRGTKVFIGHGRSTVWRELKDFVQDRLSLEWDEFNRVPVAGVTNIERLLEMLDGASIAFLVLTGEDETAEGTTQARLNVVHEAGLFQGRLGFRKAIIILEDGCAEFSNIHGLGQVRFSRGNISAVFEDVRRVLEREGLLPK